MQCGLVRRADLAKTGPVQDSQGARGSQRMGRADRLSASFVHLKRFAISCSSTPLPIARLNRLPSLTEIGARLTRLP